MKNAFLLGVLLVVLGGAGLVYDKISVTTKEKAVDLGPIEVVREKEEKVEIPKLAAMLTVAAGMVLIVYGSVRSTVT